MRTRSDQHHPARLVLALLTVLACSAAIATPAAQAGSIWVTDGDMHSGASGSCNAFQPGGDLSEFSVICQNNIMVIYSTVGAVQAHGHNAFWQTTAPPGVTIAHAWTRNGDVPLSYTSGGLVIGDFWKDNSTGAYHGSTLAPGQQWFNTALEGGSSNINSSIYGIQIACTSSPNCNPSFIVEARVNGIELQGIENTAPHVAGGGALWGSRSWVWSPPNDPLWPVSVSGTDVSGICSSSVTVASRTLINGPAEPRDTSVWQQCPNPIRWSFNVDTRSYVSTAGSFQISLNATNAAGVVSPATIKTVRVDNEPVALRLSGPTTASTTAGTQYVTAQASAGPSGVAIGCSVDGAPVQWHLGATDSVPVAGAGEHVVSCRAHNGAVDPQGQFHYSAARSWSLNIGQPTVSDVSFTKIVDQLKCHTVHKRVKVKSGRRRVKTVTVERCHPRIAWKRETVLVKVHRHGKTVTIKRTRRVRVVLMPHAVTKAKERVAFGHGATVSGWLGTATSAIAGAPVHVLTAPNNGLGHYSLAAATTTAANGSWNVKIPAGPSRLVEATYAGAAGLLPASSTSILLNVPARIRLSITPRAVLWRDAIRVSGSLVGGYVPPDGVALRLLVRYPGTKHPTTLRAMRTDAAGRFRFSWSYHSGSGVITYPLSVATTAAETDFAFAPNHSRVIHVTFGERLPRQPRHHRHR